MGVIGDVDVAISHLVVRATAPVAAGAAPGSEPLAPGTSPMPPSGMTYAVVSVHSPKPEHRADVIDSMQRYSRVAREQAGLQWTGVVDDGSGRLVGIALWASAEAAAAARPALMAEVGDDPFEMWDERPIDGFRGDVV